MRSRRKQTYVELFKNNSFINCEDVSTHFTNCSKEVQNIKSIDCNSNYHYMRHYVPISKTLKKTYDTIHLQIFDFVKIFLYLACIEL